MRGARVLIADDDGDMRAWLRAVLGACGASVAEAESGVELIEQLVREPEFDLVVTDVRMSWATGAQVLTLVREAGVRTPFLVITASPERGLEREVAALDAVLLRKPLDEAGFVATARGLLGGGPAGSWQRPGTPGVGPERP